MYTVDEKWEGLPSGPISYSLLEVTTPAPAGFLLLDPTTVDGGEVILSILAKGSMVSIRLGLVRRVEDTLSVTVVMLPGSL